MASNSGIGRKTRAATHMHLKRLNQNDRSSSNRQSTGGRKKRCKRKVKALSAFDYDPSVDYCTDPNISIGSLSIKCSYCSALKWKGETAGFCCLNGKISLEPLCPPPEPLKSLLLGSHSQSKEFLRRIREYNSAFQMTSFMSNQIVENGYMPTFKIQGQVYHLAGSLFPHQANAEKFLQIYFVENADRQANIRWESYGQQLNLNLVKSLQDMLHLHNSYVQSFKTAIERLPINTPNFQIVIHANKVPTGDHPGRYNAPTSNDVAVIVAGDQFNNRDIVLQSRCENLKRISELHRSYDSLQYPLIFCYGEDGYQINIPQKDAQSGALLGKSVSCMSFYCYRLMVRENDFNSILRYRMLLNQYVVDQYAKIESERLSYLKNNQKKLRAESYIHLKDALTANEHFDNIGQIVILPSSFTGGPRYLHERTQDAMTYVRNYGTPDLFITFTCNPNWKEIKENIFDGSSPQDRYDIINRVFNLKIHKMLFEINKVEIFGGTRCFMYTVEWQKRGLPHVHLLVWLKAKLRADQIDKIISAEIPNINEDPVLFNIVKKHMIHGPCGSLNPNSPCMREGKCSKQFPKPFLCETSTGHDGYPKYRRRAPQDGGETTTIRSFQIDNRWVVPYNPLLSKLFDAHINVELCSSVKSIKYVCKYINKGSDQATFTIDSSDEIEQFRSGRYICSSEAFWRIFGFSIHERYPSIMHLAVHLENGQRVYFSENNITNIVQTPRDTTLTAFFKLCSEDSFAKSLTYNEVPSYYTWNPATHKFQRRVYGQSVEGHPMIKKSDALGRVYVVHPNNSECFHLRLLLHVLKGPTSFNFLKTVNGVLYSTYKEACKAKGLLEDNTHWNQTLSEASISYSPQSLRKLFSIIVVFCQVSDAGQLWNLHKTSLSEDILFETRRILGNADLDFSDQIFNKALFNVNNIIYSLSSKSITDFCPQLQIDTNVIENNNQDSNITYDRFSLLEIITEREPLLNVDQKRVYDQILNSIHNNLGNTFFVDAPGGTGKTFLINLLLAKVRLNGKIAIAVASSGIAATLLSGGRTAHAMFKIPLNLANDGTTVCTISKQSNLAKLLRECSFIVWDEATMSHKSAIEAVDRTLRDLRSNNSQMGGCTVLFSGDFRQILPIVPRGTRSDEVSASLKKSYIWSNTMTLNLKINMRLSPSCPENRVFSDLILKLGNGKLSQVDGKVVLDDSLCKCVNTLSLLIDSVYPNIENMIDRPLEWLKERVILAPTNEQVEKIHTVILPKIRSEFQVYYSVDTMVESDHIIHYPTEFLNSLNPSGIPPHKLILKVGSPIILLRNLNPPALCNGTRLIIKSLKSFLIECIILTGNAAGELVLIPRIPLITTDLPFQFKRLQFPVKCCFAMTINKAQGQTMRVVGVDLSHNCFSHGQLYVALSRVTDKRNLFILSPENETKNVVYSEIF